MKKDVTIFLENLKTYLYGDLDTFESKCIEIEQTKSMSTTHSFSHKSSSIDDLIAPATTSTQTTYVNAGTSGNLEFKSEIKYFRSTIPHALAVLAAIDILGFLIGNEVLPSNTKNNISKFFEQNITDNDTIFCLVNLYRHGMSHSFFPKEGIAIAAHSKLNGKDLFVKDKNDKITLNVNTLIELMKNKFESILSDLSSYPNIEVQFKKLRDYDLKTLNNIDLQSFANKLEKMEDL